MKVLCGQCGRATEVGDHAVGPVVCASCGHKIDWPLAGAGDSAVAPTAQAPVQPSDDEGGFAEQAREVIARRIVIVCGKCGKKLHVGIRQAGKQGRCPACHEPIIIPEYRQDDESQLARFGLDEEVRQTEPEEQLAQVEFDDDLAALAATVGKRARLGRVPSRKSALAVAFISMTMLLCMVVPTLLLYKSRVVQDWGKSPATPLADTLTATQQAPEPKVVRAPVKAPPASKLAVTKEPVNLPTPPPRPAVTLVEAKADVFGTGRYAPAPLGHVYWKIKVSLASHTPLAVDSAADVAIIGPQGAIQALGVAGGPSTLPVVAERTTIALKADQEQTVTFVFDVSDKLTVGRLSINGLGQTDVSLPSARQPPIGVGQYVEMQPRNLKPLLKNPVMAAIQNAPNQRLEIRAGAGGALELELPGASVKGQAARLAGDTYQATLSAGQQTLNCAIRVIDGGQAIVLYLSDKPFHQITFAKA